MFNEYTFENDIALVQIKEHIPINSSYIATIKLATNEVTLNTLCTYSGFGYTDKVYIYF